MDSSNAASSANLVPATGASAMSPDGLSEAYQTGTDSIPDDSEEETETEEALEDNEDVMEPPAGFFNFLNTDDDEPKPAPQKPSRFIFDENNVRLRFGTSRHSHPIRDLVADSEPEFTHQWQWTQGTNPAYSEFPTMPWNHTPPEMQYPPTQPNCYFLDKYESDLARMRDSSITFAMQNASMQFANYQWGPVLHSSTTLLWNTPVQQQANPTLSDTGNSPQIQAHHATKPRDPRTDIRLDSRSAADIEKSRQRRLELDQETFDIIGSKYATTRPEDSANWTAADEEKRKQRQLEIEKAEDLHFDMLREEYLRLKAKYGLNKISGAINRPSGKRRSLEA